MTTTKSMTNKAIIQIQFSTPLCQGLGASLMGYPVVITSVISLRNQLQPTAIKQPTIFKAFFTLTTRIMQCIINAVYGMSIAGTFAHIGKKFYERISPTLTYSNAPTTIARIGLGIGVITPLFHNIPRRIFYRLTSAMFAGICSVSTTGTSIWTFFTPWFSRDFRNVSIRTSHWGFTSLVKVQSVRLGEVFIAPFRAVSIISFFNAQLTSGI